MYAVIQTGGRQYKVSQGDLITVERLQGEVGDSVSFDHVLFVGGGEEASGSIGASGVEGVRVSGTIVDQKKGGKILVFKFKRRKMYRRLRGHRQLLTGVRIDDVSLPKPSEEKVATTTKKSKPRAKKPSKTAETEATGTGP